MDLVSDSAAAIALFVDPNGSTEQHSTALNSIILQVHGRKLALQEVVAKLGPQLTSTEDNIRKRGTLLLSEIITRLPTLQLSAPVVAHLVQFFCDRVADYPCILEVCKGLHALLNHHQLAIQQGTLTLPNGQTTSLFARVTKALFFDIHIQSLTQAARKACLDMVLLLLRRYSVNVKEAATEFSAGVIQAVDGEKDPRNLLVSFQCVRETMLVFPESVLSPLYEELFDITSCYFPITFNPPANDPNKITGEDLRQGLRQCFVAKPALAPFVFPFLLDKLSSTLTEAKADAMLTLVSCVEGYDLQVVSPYLETIWNGLKREIYSSIDSEITDLALDTIHKIVKVLAKDSQPVHEGLTPSWVQEFILPIVQHGTAQLRIPDTKAAVMSSRLIQSVASASVVSLRVVLPLCLPPTFEKLGENLNKDQRLFLFEFILDLIRCAAQFNSVKPARMTVESVQQELVQNLAQGIAESGDHKVRAVAIRGYCELVLFSGTGSEAFIAETEVKSFLMSLTNIVLTEPELLVRTVALDSIGELAHARTDFMVSTCLPLFLSSLRQALDRRSEVRMGAQDSDVAEVDIVINALVTLSAHAPIYSSVLPVLLQCIETEGPPLQHTHCELQASILNGLSGMLSQNLSNVTMADHSVRILAPELLDLLLRWCAQLKTVHNGDAMEINEHVLSTVTKMFRSIVQVASEEGCKELLSKTLKLLGQTDSSLDPLSLNSTLAAKQMLLVFTSIVGSLPRSIQIENAETLLPKLLSVAVDWAFPEFGRVSLAKVIAAIVNKSTKGEDLANLLTTMLDGMLLPLCFHTSICSAPQRAAAILTLSWIMKGLLMSSHPRAISLLTETVALFPTPESRGLDFDSKMKDDCAIVYSVASAMYEVIMTDSEEVLCKSTHAVVSPLYKQKTFVMVFPLLLEGYHKCTDDEDKAFYLKAVGHLLANIPQHILLEHTKTVLPLLIKALGSTDAQLQVVTLSVFVILVKEAVNIVAEHASTLIPMFLQLTTFQRSMSVRVSAIQCLQEFTRLPFVRIFPFQRQVINDLKQALDDPKRLVRRHAVLCRNEWSVLSESHDHSGHGHDHAGHAH
eukprot:GILK01006515.1.p1 GENE.GILK01006515.1~~GILK01006515.1.p1  ORF type:complete len:1082 (+),score=185.82 GILK01006515.1:34-3279(+)